MRLERGSGEMSKSRMTVPFRVLTIVILLFAAVRIVGLHAKIAEKQEQLQALDLRVEEYEASNEALREELAGGVTDEDISEIARSELGYAEPGERVFVDTSSK